ncbi:Prolyl 4-hydroxylase alpha subunit [Penicillium nucicola]|uniref:Prolyl 4-hydroxylase alpha subunit n=1 Tax=Penicillium nucicola TaxID=1850975 RepID=UPI0025456BF3|nr:Prolyl 4-hydroxylase alpha subunit [Penicillium nucicola]KAJ5762112.1 Prolyl 4-hydroxylase alpha subunit [Penicillium nucicola]
MMAFHPIDSSIATDFPSLNLGLSAAGAQDLYVCLTNGTIALHDHDKETPVAQIPLKTDTQVWPDGLEGLDLLTSNETLLCPDVSGMQSYTLHKSPHIIYIPNFVSPDETAHLIDVTKDSFYPSVVYREGVSEPDNDFRKSENAWPLRDNTIKCVEQRALRFQTWQSNLKLEQLSLQRYFEGGFFTYHHDYFSSPPKRLNRYSTFNVFLHGNCTGGGTHFPRIPRPTDPMWCKYIDCESSEDGVIFKPIAGSAVFWINMRNNGSGFEETWHAGMPVTSGTKIGMNIWSWK